MCRKKCIALHVHTRKAETSKINHLNLYFKKLEKKSKGIIKTKMKINAIESRKTEKYQNIKKWFFKNISTKLTNL